MDLTFTEDQTALADLAETILSDRATPEALRAVEVADDPDAAAFVRDLWQTFATSGLVGIGIDEAYGGGGCGLVEVGLLIEVAARHAVHLPLEATLVLGAGAIDAFGSDAQQTRWLPGVAAGTVLLSSSTIGEDDRPAELAPAVHRSGVAGDQRLTGRLTHVPYAALADAFVVPIALGEGSRALAVVPGDRAGIIREAAAPMSGEPSGVVTFDGVAFEDDDLLEGSTSTDGAPLRSWRDRAVATTCIAQVGTCDGALALTARYVSEREQFGAKLATFQAVSQRAADAYIDTELVRLTAWHALWRLATQRDATEQLSVAKHFAAEAAQRVVFAAQHLHGGIGVDLDYPIHRYFRNAKSNELRHGSGAEHLAELGRSLARTP